MQKPAKKGVDIDALKKKYGQTPVKSPALTIKRALKANIAGKKDKPKK